MWFTLTVFADQHNWGKLNVRVFDDWKRVTHSLRFHFFSPAFHADYAFCFKGCRNVVTDLLPDV